MSATVDAQRFATYFHGAPILNVPGRTFPVDTLFLEDAIELTGHTVDDDGPNEQSDTDVDVDTASQRDSKPPGNFQQYSAPTRSTLLRYDEYKIDYGLICKLIEMLASDYRYTHFSKAILVFLPGIAEIRRLHDMLVGTSTSQGYLVHVLHSSVASEDQQRAFAYPPNGLRKIVLSTNIAETGVVSSDLALFTTLSWC